MKITKNIPKIIISCAFVLLIFGMGLLYYYSRNLPSLDSLVNYEPRLVTSFYDKDEKVFAEYSKEKRIKLNVGEIPQIVKNAFVAAEDETFFEHGGINPWTILRAAYKTYLLNQKQGGSTITQQVAKNFLLSFERSYKRKIKEMFLAFRIEKALTKDQILNLYLNQIYLGQGAYGVAAASEIYFGKPIEEISLPEAAILAALPKAPSRDNPVTNPGRSKGRQGYVLRQMLDTKSITQEEFNAAKIAEVKISNKSIEVRTEAPYFAEHVRRYIAKTYGSESLYEGGLQVHTTLDLEAQKVAQLSLDHGLTEIDKRLGLRPSGVILETEEEKKSFLKKQAKEITESFYDYKILAADGKLLSPVEKEENIAAPLEDNKIYEAIVRGKDSRNKGIEISIGNITGTISQRDYRWAELANPGEVYKVKIIRKPYSELKVGEIINVAYLKEKGKDRFLLKQPPLVQGALLSYNIDKGTVISMVGGYDFYTTRSEFNRAVQAKRQTGSTFKPLLYSAALDNGLTLGSIIVDSPIVYRNSSEKDVFEKTWKPDNYGSKFYGDTTLRNSLAFSRNIPTIKILQHTKISKVSEYVKKLGINAELNNDLSLALGSSSVSLEEMLRAFGIFANKGKKLKPYYIRKIVDRNGEILEDHSIPKAADKTPDAQAKNSEEEEEKKEEAEETDQVISKATAFLVTEMLQSVVNYGTAQSVKSLGRPTAGKTGTTNDYKDAWFIGYTPQILTGVWVGFDEDHPIGRNETGGRSAAPIWLEFMKYAHKDLPPKNFDVPEDVVRIAIDAETGDLPSATTKKQIFEYFKKGTAPGEAIEGSESGEVNRPVVVTGHSGKLNNMLEDENSAIRDDNSGDVLRDEY